MSPMFRWVVKWARTTHLYLTLFALGLLLFFAVTGFMLNHEDWFKAKSDGSTASSAEVEITGEIPLNMLGDVDAPMQVPPSYKATNKLAIVEYLRKNAGAVGHVETEQGGFENTAPDELAVHFKRAGSQCDIFITRETGVYRGTLRKDQAEFWMDLHRGKETSTLWHWIIDAVAVLYFVLAVTGLIMWWSLKGRGKQGGWVIAAGLILTITVIVVVELWLANWTGSSQR